MHRQAVNVLLDDGPAFTLLDEALPIQPWAVSLPLEPLGSQLRPGHPVRAHNTELIVGPATVLLHEMKVEDLRIHFRPQLLRPELVPRLREWENPGDRRSPRTGPAPDEGPFARMLLAATDSFQAGGNPADLAALLGLGEGLTPSGDDVLVGVLAGLDFARDAWPGAAALRRRLAEALAGALGDRLTDEVADRSTGALGDPLTGALSGLKGERTTRLSAQMLRAAFAGWYAEPVLMLLTAASDQEAQPLDAAITALLSMGHRSGSDTLRGIVAALGRAADSSSSTSTLP